MAATYNNMLIRFMRNSKFSCMNIINFKDFIRISLAPKGSIATAPIRCCIIACTVWRGFVVSNNVHKRASIHGRSYVLSCGTWAGRPRVREKLNFGAQGVARPRGNVHDARERKQKCNFKFIVIIISSPTSNLE